MTLESCAAFCYGFKYFGAEYSGECFCGNTLHASSAAAPIGECNMICSGNQYEYCGDGNRLELYVTDNVAAGPKQPPTVGPFTFLGCQMEPANGVRALAELAVAADSMTNEACASFCSGYTYFGTEYGRECYCANSLSLGSAVAPASECNMLCAGAPTEYCGAGNRVSVYKK
jgi:hypothetical protein